MIGEGKFRAEMARGWTLLEKFELAVYQNPKPANDRNTIARIRAAATYPEEYNRYVSTQAYDVLLDDGSLLFFRREPQAATELSYGYLESPYDVVPYSAFLAEHFGAEESSALEAWDDYEEYRAQAPLRPHVVPMRYDWSPKLYHEGTHPAGHLHLGFRTEIRLAVDGILTPAHFVLLVVRQCYVQRWEKMVQDSDEPSRIAKALAAEPLETTYRKGRDLLELRMSQPAAQPEIASDGASRRR